MLSFSTLAVTIEEADDYADSRGRVEWVGTGQEKLAALRRGQDYIASRFNARWAIAFDDTNAPEVVRYAIAEAAMIEIATPGVLAPTVTPGKAKVLTEVKGIKWELVGSDKSFIPVLSTVEGLLFGMVRGFFLNRPKIYAVG